MEKIEHLYGEAVQDPPPTASTILWKTGRYVEAQISLKHPGKSNHCKKLDKGHYVDLTTGELKEYHLREQTIRPPSAFHRLRRLINTNFHGSFSERHITLTYKTLNTSAEQLSKDFKAFWKKFRYRYPNFEYIAIPEFHKSHGWHMHVLVKCVSGDNLFLPHAELSQLWGHGYIWISEIAPEQNIGAYFVPSSREILAEKERSKKKQICAYPANMKIYHCSKGIQVPKSFSIPYGELSKVVGETKPYFKSSITVSEDNELLNAVIYEQFDLSKKMKA